MGFKIFFSDLEKVFFISKGPEKAPLTPHPSPVIFNSNRFKNNLSLLYTTTYMTDTEATSSSNEELISKFLTLKDTLIKNGVDLNIIKGTPLRKKTKAEYNAYFKEYMKDRYSSNPEYKAKVKERSQKAYLLKKKNIKILPEKP